MRKASSVGVRELTELEFVRVDLYIGNFTGKLGVGLVCVGTYLFSSLGGCL